MPEWDADIEIDAALVRALLQEQFPDLDAASARLLAEGWDNAVWVVEERLAFRFPRRGIAVPLVARELAVLPPLALRVPIALPVPQRVGVPSDRFPRPFLGAALLPGRELTDSELRETERDEIGRRLGGFLRALHDAATGEAVDPDRRLPVDPNGRADMAVRVPKTRDWLARLDDLSGAEAAAAHEILYRAEQLPPSGAEVLVHGDFHVRHVLLENGEPTGVIDWGDVCVGDPAIDLQFAWSLLPPERRDVFLDAYGPVDEETRLRARVLAIFLSALLTDYARAEHLAGLEREARAGLARALAD